MKNPSIEQREAIGRIQFSNDGKKLITYLHEAVDEAQSRMVLDEDAHRVRMFQGQCRTLRDLIDLLTPVSS